MRILMNVVPFVLLVLLLAFIVGIVLDYKLRRLLRKRHPEKWEQLGRPTLITNNSIKNNFAVMKFLKSKEYFKMNDQELTKMAQLVWKYDKFYLVYSIIAIVLFVIFLFSDVQ